MEGVDPNDEALIDLPVDDGAKRRRATAPTRQRSRKTGPVLLALAIAVLGLFGANLLLADDPAPEEAAAEEEPLPVSPDAFTARPNATFTDLLDGESVRYELDSLPFSAETVTVVCLVDPDPTAASLLDECDSGTAQRRLTSPGGVLETDITVYRQIAVAGFRRIDCTEQSCELRTYSEQASGVVVGRATLEWATAPAERLGPQITIESDDRLIEGGAFTVVGTGFPADTSIHIRPCRLGLTGAADAFACEWILADEVIQTGPDGTFRHDDIADWEIGFGADAITCAQLTDGWCAMTVSLPGAVRQPAAVPLDIARDRLAGAVVRLPETFVVSQTDGLVDGDLVGITTDEWFSSSQLELAICAEDAEPGDCMLLTLGRPLLAGVEIPRAFGTLRGTRHDCVVDEPCVLTVFSFRDPEQRLEVPISFDPEAELQAPTPLTVTPTSALEDSTLLTIDFDDLVSVPLVSICAIGERLTCQSLDIDQTTGRQLVTNVSTALETPAGPHNCLIDGPCELFVWDAAELTRFETVPLDFAPVDQQPLTGVARPSDGLLDGQAVQIGVGNAIDDVSVSMCATEGECVPLVVTPTISGRATFEFTAVQRFEVQLADGTVQRTDCAVDACEVRISDGWATDRIPLTFDVTAPQDAALEVGVAEPLPLDEPFTVRGRGFTPTIQPSEIRLLLCPPWAELDSSCVRIGTVPTRRLTADGTFEVSVTIPSSGFTTGFQNAMDRCGRECVLVARPLLGESVELPVIRSATPP